MEFGRALIDQIEAANAEDDVTPSSWRNSPMVRSGAVSLAMTVSVVSNPTRRIKRQRQALYAVLRGSALLGLRQARRDDGKKDQVVDAEITSSTVSVNSAAQVLGLVK